MKIHGLSVMRNEADRYLADCLQWNLPFFDDWFIWDDRSTDGSVDLAETLSEKITVGVRGMTDLSFMEHEGRFRQDGWEAFEKAIRPEHKDVVVAVDLDEFITLKESCDPAYVRSAFESFAAKAGGYVSQEISFVEVFDVDLRGVPSFRTDGFWGNISGKRLFSYKVGGKFPDRPMGCGSAPEYVLKTSALGAHPELRFLHYGYAVFEDRVDKFDRYSSLGNSGHHSSHINSILTLPTLHQWAGPHPFLSEK